MEATEYLMAMATAMAREIHHPDANASAFQLQEYQRGYRDAMLRAMDILVNL